MQTRSILQVLLLALMMVAFVAACWIPSFAANQDSAVTTGRKSNYPIQHKEDQHTPRDSLASTEYAKQLSMGLATVNMGTSSNATQWFLNATDQVANARAMVLKPTNSTANFTITVPDWAGKPYVVDNWNAHTCTVSASGGTDITIAANKTAMVYVNPDYNIERVSADQ